MRLKKQIMKPFPIAGPMLIEIERQQDVCILHCKGSFVAGKEPEYLCTKMEEIKKLNCGKVVADFHDVDAIGSMGIAFLVGLYTSVIKNPAGRFVLAGACPFVRHVLDLTRISTVIPMTADLPSGLAALGVEARPAITPLPARARRC